MDQKYIIHCKSVVQLGDEIKKAVDNYWNREITDIKLKELLYAWAKTGKLFKGTDYNKTINKLCGKSRMSVVEKLLEGYQHKLL